MKTDTDQDGTAMQCCFCYPSEQGKNGNVERELFDLYHNPQILPVCRKHSQQVYDKQQSCSLEKSTV